MPIRDHADAPVGVGDAGRESAGGLLRLQIEHLRNLAGVDLAPAATLNLIYGANASGKTSVLEAIYLLSRGRSFRSRLFHRLVTRGEDRYRVIGRVAKDGRAVSAAIERSKAGLRVRVDGRDMASLAPLSTLLPVQILHPNSHKLLEEGPQFRRRFLDWGVFHVEPNFYGQWQRYQRALRQRNAALRQGGPAQAWDAELVQSGSVLDQMRRDYLSALGPLVKDLAVRLLDAPQLSLEYQGGWSADRCFEEALRAARDKDQERGFTSVGPHRGDLKVRWQGVNAAEQISRGQQKLLVCALVCAQTALFQQRSGRRAVLLVDDLPAELDPLRRNLLTAQLEALNAQVFITAIEPETLAFTRPCRAFHVEHGAIREVV